MTLGWLSRTRRTAFSPEAARHIALGTFCHTAAALRDAGLRHWAGPFDWLFTTPGLIAACLTDDLAALLDPRHLVSVRPEDLSHGAKRQCRHPAYEARYGLPILFNHHDPAASGADMRRLRRAAERLRAALRGSGPNVFYTMSEVPWPEEELARLARTLAGFRARNTLVVVTLAAGEGPRGHVTTPVESTGCTRVDVMVATGSRSLGAAFADRADDAHLRDVIKSVASQLDPATRGDRV